MTMLRQTLFIVPLIFVVTFCAARLVSAQFGLWSAHPVGDAAATVVEVRTSVLHDEVGLVEDGTGSGVVVDDRGYVITCYHVVAGVDQILIEWDGRRAVAEVVAFDAHLDLALLKAEQRLPDAATWGNSDKLRRGDEVWAVGFPLDLTKMARRGVISAPLYIIDDTTFLVTDAAVNLGDSGGGLFDARGYLVGIPARVQCIQGLRANIGIAYAIPGNVAQWFVSQHLPKKDQ